MLNIPIAKPPSPDSPAERAAWDTFDRYMREVTLPAISNKLEEFMVEVNRIVKACDLTVRDVEQRGQRVVDSMTNTTDELRSYLIATKQTIGELGASDRKQDQSIADLWNKVNSISDRVKSLESGQAVTEHMVHAINADIHGSTTTPNTPGVIGMLTSISAKLDGIQQQAGVTNASVQEHDRRLEALATQMRDSGGVRLLKMAWKYRGFWLAFVVALVALGVVILQLRNG